MKAPKDDNPLRSAFCSPWIMLPFFMILGLPLLHILGGRYYSLWDLSIPPLNLDLQLMRYTHLWDESITGGRVFSYSWVVPLLLEVRMASALLPGALAVNAVFYAHYVLAGFGAYLLFRSLFATTERTVPLNLAALLVGTVAMYNKYWTLRGHYFINVTFILAYLPFIFLLIDRILRKDTLRRHAVAILGIALLSFLMIPGLSNLPAMAACVLFLGMFCIALGMLRRIPLAILATKLMFIVLAMIPLHLAWLLPNFFSDSVLEAMGRTGSYLSFTMASIIEQSNNDAVGYAPVFSSRCYWIFDESRINLGAGINYTDYIWHHDHPVMIALAFMPLLIILWSFWKGGARRSPFILALITTLLVFTPILTLLRPPFGDFIAWLAQHTPFFVFRRPQTYMFLVEFSLAILLGVAALCVMQLQIGRRWRTLLFTGMLAVVITLGFQRVIGARAYYNAVERSTNHIKRIPADFTVPDYVTNLAEHLNAQENQDGALIIPPTRDIWAYDWEDNGGYMGFDIYHFLLARPVTSNYSPRHNLYGFMKRVDQAFRSNDTERLRAIFGFLGLRYIIVKHDTFVPPVKGLGEMSVEEQYRLTILAGAKPVESFGKHVLLEAPEAPWMFQSPVKVDFVRLSKELAVEAALEQPGTALLDIAFWPRDLPLQDVAKGDAVSIIAWVKPRPTEYHLELRRNGSIDEPALILANLFFNQGWEARDQQGRLLSHVLVNGVQNGWLIPPESWDETGQCRVTLRFAPQDFADTLIRITVAFLLLYAGWLLIEGLLALRPRTGKIRPAVD